ncbi:alginate O-acetyltransferase AlgX-related protein [Ornithinicoccus halotolerans]|uniref:alginate O-acetyltransferase AlgX-related protein n=1 Tax=Ornithinicoccus halotolerans TaxID=1748220 RepID=UPI0012955760|nr:hypothetical protein [Ornithinicoccus halotolerans]
MGLPRRRHLEAIAGAGMLAPVVTAGMPLWYVSAATRWLAQRPWVAPQPFPRPLVEYSPLLGIRPRRNLDTYGQAEEVFRVRTDPHGRRHARSLADAAVVAFGDSFAFGYGVDDDDCFTEHCGDLTVKSVASPAHSMVHGLLMMQETADQLRGKTALWFIYCGNDLTDNLHPNLGATRVPFVRTGRDGQPHVTTEHVCAEPWAFSSPPRDNDRLFAEVCTPSVLQDRAFSAADYLISEASTVCASAGARLVVVAIPPTAQVLDAQQLAALGSRPEAVDLDSAERFLAQSARSRNAGFLALRRHLTRRHYWRHDMHWNPRGHRAVGHAVARSLRAPTRERGDRPAHAAAP